MLGFLYRLFVGITLIGIVFVAYVTKLANDGPQIRFDETMAYARWGWLFCMLSGLFAVLFANLYENRRRK